VYFRPFFDTSVTEKVSATTEGTLGISRGTLEDRYMQIEHWGWVGAESDLSFINKNYI
jgi:hypothetical protein